VRSGPNRTASDLDDDLVIVCTFDFRDLQAEITERSAEKPKSFVARRTGGDLRLHTGTAQGVSIAMNPVTDLVLETIALP
jgi:hypothetical protein